MNFLVIDSSVVTSNEPALRLDLGIPGLIDTLSISHFSLVIQSIISYARIALQFQTQKTPFVVFCGDKIMYNSLLHPEISVLECLFASNPNIDKLNVDALVSSVQERNSVIYLFTKDISQYATIKTLISQKKISVQLKSFTMESNPQKQYQKDVFHRYTHF
jgi:hypothetical protein